MLGIQGRCVFARLFTFLLAGSFTLSLAQVTTTAIRGLVVDPSHAAIPDAGLVLKDTATGIQRESHTGVDGSFVFANLPAGAYDLTATCSGFQTAIYRSVVVDSGRTTDISVEMKIGATSQSVEVAAAAVQLETTSNEVGTTINNRLIEDLPYSGRDTLNMALWAPGAQTTSGYSTFNGLPNASMNISLDGMNNNSQRFKSGGTSFYEFAPARLDAVEQITVSTTGLGADAAGEGAMQIRFVTKRGTDRYRFHLLYQFSNEDLNANSYFNKLQGIRRPKTRNTNYIGNVGGPLLPWVRYFRNKLFFFANFEEQPIPGSTTYRTTVLQPETLNGAFTYFGTDGANHTVNLLQVAAAGGFPGTVDSTMGGVLKSIQATEKSGSVVGYLPISNVPYERTLMWGFATDQKLIYPTVRLDFQITPKVGWHGTWSMTHRNIIGNPNYPEGPYPSNNAYKLNAPVTTNAVDYTISPHLLNNFMFGTQSNMEYFNNPSDIRQWADYGDRNFALPLISPLIPNNTPWARNNPVYQVTDTLTWSRGRHTLSIGAAMLSTSFYERSYGSAGVMNYSFGVTTNDAVGTVIQNALTAVNPNTSDIANAKSLYAMLTGRISSLSTSYNVDESTKKYQQFAPLMQRFARTTMGVFFQDSFRLTPELTLNYGLRWQFDGAIHNTNGIDSWPDSLWGPSNGPFQPGKLNGNNNPQFAITSYPYSGDFKNAAPNVGLAWNPKSGGPLGRLLGQGKTVIRASYGINYYNEGLNTISNLLCCNPGTTQSASAAAAIAANPGAYNLTTPLPPFSTSPASFTFPIPMSNYVLNGGVSPSYANPDLKSPYVQNWTVGIQRQLAEGMVLDVRYVGNKATHVWHYQNMQETNIFENGFLPEFVNAQNNLAINQANGKGATFANNGLAGQAPLPIFQTAFGANGSQAALTASQGFANSTFITNLQQGSAGTLANSLATTSSATYYCRLVGANFAPCAALGYTGSTPYPMNFLRANPYASSLYYQDDNANSNYNALQVHLRKSFRHGLLLDESYTWSHTLGTVQNLSGQTSDTTWWTLRNGRLNYGPTPFDHRHSFTSIWMYELPMGRGKWINTPNPVLNQLAGGWTIGGVERIISGAPNLLTGGRATFNNLGADGGVLFGGGLTLPNLLDRLNTMTTGQYVASCTCFKTNVADLVAASGAPDPKFLAPGATPGVIGPMVWYSGKTTFQLDLSLSKDFRISERTMFGLKAEASNFLNHPFFGMGNIGVTSTNFGNITSASGTRAIVIRAFLDF